MKRSGPLRRKTPLKPGGPLKRTPLKRISNRRRKLMAAVKPFRDAYLARHLVCEVCLRRQPIELHEICSGAHREKALDKEYAVLAVCRTCHREIQSWAKSVQLALKVIRSPEMFGLNFGRINKLRGWSDNEFEPMDVFKHLEVVCK
jgi:hypothetical protein